MVSCLGPRKDMSIVFIWSNWPMTFWSADDSWDTTFVLAVLQMDGWCVVSERVLVSIWLCPPRMRFAVRTVWFLHGSSWDVFITDPFAWRNVKATFTVGCCRNTSGGPPTQYLGLVILFVDVDVTSCSEDSCSRKSTWTKIYKKHIAIF